MRLVLNETGMWAKMLVDLRIIAKSLIEIAEELGTLDVLPALRKFRPEGERSPKFRNADHTAKKLQKWWQTNVLVGS